MSDTLSPPAPAPPAAAAHASVFAADPRAPRRHRLVCIAVLLVAGVAAYATSLGGAFVLDDRVHILEDPRIRSVLPLGETLGPFDRSLVRLSLALNYAVSEALTGHGLDPRSYNLFNLVIHLLAGLTLFGLVRRVLARAGPRALWRRHAHWLALGVALLWLVHPLATQAVTYTIQRAESLAALFYLLALYALLRSDPTPRALPLPAQPSPAAPRAIGWLAVAGLACVLGAMAKPTIVTAPVAMLLLDRAVLTGSFKRTLRRRWPFYLLFVLAGLGLSAYLLYHTLGRETTAGFGVQTITPLAYLAHQPLIVLHYLRLAVWPVGLTFDYDWQQASSWVSLVPAWIGVGVLLVAALWALWRRPLIGTAAAAFFLILAPTSSLVPFDDLAVEHRMYLPLAALAALLVPAAWWLLRRMAGRVAVPAGVGALASVALVLGVATAARNLDYASPETLWADTAAKVPHNHRAHHNLAAALFRRGELEAAQHWYERTLALDEQTEMAAVRTGLARTHVQRGALEEAARHYQRVIEHTADDPHAPALHGLGTLRARQGRLDEAAGLLRRALEADPRLAEAHADMAQVHHIRGEAQAAIASLRQALELRPDHARWHNELGTLLAMQDELRQAVTHFERAVALEPGYAEARANLERARGMVR